MNKTKKHFIVLLLIFTGIPLFASCAEANAFKIAEESATIAEAYENYKAYLQEYPDGKHAGESEKALLNTTICLAAEEYELTDNPEYKPENKDTYKIYIIDTTTYKAAQNNMVNVRDQNWTELLPDELKAESIYEASLFCLVKEGYFETGTEQYSTTGSGGGMDVHGYQVFTVVEIREAQTGELLYTSTHEGSKPLFPSTIESGTGSVVGSKLTYAELENWLFGVLY